MSVFYYLYAELYNYEYINIKILIVFHCLDFLISQMLANGSPSLMYNIDNKIYIR